MTISNLYQKYELLWVALLAIVAYAFGYFAWQGFEYVDTDSYTRALRVLAFYNTGSWGEFLTPYSNYPFGEILHWTRPLDVFWLLCSWPLLLFMDIRDAIFYGGGAMACAFGVLSVVIAAWGLRGYLSPFMRAITAFLLLMQCPVLQIVFFYRPDHHALLAFVTVAIISLFLQYVNKDNKTYLFVMGLLAGLSIWVAVEGLILTYLVIGIFCVFTLRGEEKITSLLYFIRGAFIVVLSGWVVNPPMEGYWFIDNGRLSILQVFILLFTYFAMLFIARIEETRYFTTRLKKIFWFVFFTTLFIALLFAIMPYEQVLASPFADKIKAIWVRRVSELQGIFVSFKFFMLYGAVAITALLPALYAFYKMRGKQLRVIIFLDILLIVYTFLSFYGIRFTSYSYILAVFVFMLVAGFFWQRGFKKTVVAFLMFFFSFSVWQVSSILTEAYPDKEKLIERSILWSFFSDKDGSVLTDVFTAPQFVWITGKPVVGTPYHRNVEGIFDNHYMFFTIWENELRELLLKHKVSYIYLPSSWDGTYFFAPVSHLNRLYAKVVTGKELPCWLVKIENEHGYTFHLYQVDKRALKYGCNNENK